MNALGILLVVASALLLVRRGLSVDPDRSQLSESNLEHRILRRGGDADAGADADADADADAAISAKYSGARKYLEEASRTLGAGKRGGAGAGADAGAGGEMPGIIAGVRSGPGEFPFFVQPEGFECGAALVARDVVLSAAHCEGVFGRRVLVGAYRRGTTEGGARWRDVRGPMYVHPDYDPFFYRNDAMLFKIAPTNATPVELNTDPDDPAAGANLTVAGFGFKRNDVPVQPKYLQKVTVQSVSDDVCRTLTKYSGELYGYNTSYEPDIMTCSMGITEDGSLKGQCNGDSGGPLLNAAGKLVGVVSWGAQHRDKACGVPIFPGVYTRVSAVADWVQETICRLTDDASALPFSCPDFVCPADTPVFRISNVTVPSASASGARSFNGFTPVSVVQSPAAGSPLKVGQVTFINVTATDSVRGSISCRWKVTVPNLGLIGTTQVLLKEGRSGSRQAFELFRDVPGVVHQFKSVVDGSLEGKPDGVVRARIRSGQGRPSPYLTLKGDPATASLTLRSPLPYTYRSNLRVLVTAKNVPNTTLIVYRVYGQEAPQ